MKWKDYGPTGYDAEGSHLGRLGNSLLSCGVEVTQRRLRKTYDWIEK